MFDTYTYKFKFHHWWCLPCYLSITAVGERSERSQLAHLLEKLWSGEWHVTRLHALCSLGSDQVTAEVDRQDKEPSHHPWCACWHTYLWLMRSWNRYQSHRRHKGNLETSQALERYTCMVSMDILTVPRYMYGYSNNDYYYYLLNTASEYRSWALFYALPVL